MRSLIDLKSTPPRSDIFICDVIVTDVLFICLGETKIDGTAAKAKAEGEVEVDTDSVVAGGGSKTKTSFSAWL